MKFKLYFPTYGIIIIFSFLTYMYFSGGFASEKLKQLNIKNSELKFSYPYIFSKSNLTASSFIIKDKKPTLVYVFLPFCGSCLNQIRFLSKFKDKYNLIGITLEPETASKEWLKQFSDIFNKGLAYIPKNNNPLKDLKIDKIPNLLLLSNKGDIMYSYSGNLTFNSWKKKILPKIEEINI